MAYDLCTTPKYISMYVFVSIYSLVVINLFFIYSLVVVKKKHHFDILPGKMPRIVFI